MAEIRPHGLKERLDPFGRHARMQQVAFDTKCLQGAGLVPDQAAGDRSGVCIERSDIGRTAPLTLRHAVLEAGPHSDAAQPACEFIGFEQC